MQGFETKNNMPFFASSALPYRMYKCREHMDVQERPFAVKKWL